MPSNPACAAAVAATGTTPFYNWFAVLRSDGAGRTRGFIPGRRAVQRRQPLTSRLRHAALRLAADPPHRGRDHRLPYSNWAAHPGWFYVYITKDGYDPTKR